jgi:hypothetical protein
MSDRSLQTIHAAELFHGQALAIATACAEAGPEEIVVAAVTEDMGFAGIWTIAKQSLLRHVEGLDGGWSMTFSAGTTVEDVEERALQLARLSFAKWEAMRKWESRHR